MTANSVPATLRAAVERIVRAAHVGQQKPPGHKAWVRWYVWQHNGKRVGGTGSDLAAALTKAFGFRVTPQLVGLIRREQNFRGGDGEPPEIAQQRLSL